MNPNLLLGGLLAGGVVAAGAAMFLNGDFSSASEQDVAFESESRAPKLAIRTPNALGQLFGVTNIGGNGPITDPSQTVRTETYGYDIRHPGMISDTGTLHLVQDILLGLPGQGFAAPSAINQVALSQSCIAPEIPDGAQFVNVHVGQSELASPIKAYSNARMAQLVGDWIGQTKLRSRYAGNQPDGADATGLVNLTITDAEGPVYLVLQGAIEPVVWNLQLAQGVDIAQIVMVGHPGQTVVPPINEPVTPIAALSISDDCAPEPARAPAEHWGMIGAGVLSEGTVSEYVSRANKRYEAYDNWFQATFDRASEDGVVGAWKVSNILIGPVPQNGDTFGQPYVPMTDRTAYSVPADNFFLADRDARAAEAAAQLDLATRAAGGDLAFLTPQPMEREQ